MHCLVIDCDKLVSIVIPIYNAEKTLQRCVESVANQTYRKIEIILIDDGSTDESYKLCNAFAVNDKRIRFVHTNNHGVSAARNLGISLASGCWVTFIDSDDAIADGMIEYMVYAALRENTDLVITPLDRNDQKEEFTICLRSGKKEELLFLLRKSLLFGPTAKLYRKEILNRYSVQFPEQYSYGEDLLFNLSYLNHVDKIIYLNVNFYQYLRNNSESLSNRIRWDQFSNDMKLHGALKEWLISHDYWEEGFKIFLANRVFGTASDAVMLLCRKDCPWKVNEQYRYIKKIVNDDLVQWSLLHADTRNYASWIVKAFQYRLHFLLYTVISLKRR